jgi:hypothetical protein
VSEHAEVREALELAAVEPGGLARLAAGDSPDAAAVAGHLAGCPDCLEELDRLQRADALLRPLLAAGPDPALRERTLAFVRAVGVPRGEAAMAPGSARAAVTAPRRISTSGWVAAIAAALVIGLVGGGLVVGAGSPRGNADPSTALRAIAAETATLYAAGDSRAIALVDAGGAAAGTLILSPSKGRLVVAATGLAAAPAGSAYRCWVEVGDERIVLGTMWRAGGVDWWAGDVDVPADLPPGIVYGISLGGADPSLPGTVVLTGAL